VKIVAISGSLRSGSSNSALLRAAARIAPDGVSIVLYDGLGGLPHFNPDDDRENGAPPATVKELRRLLIEADGVLISSPEYAHGVPGVLKNMLDWLVSTGELAGKPVALLNASPSGGRYAQESLLETLRTMNWRVIAEASRIEPFVRGRIAGELVEEAALLSLTDSLASFARAIDSR
jgi:chromate reductase, NAD(P)H dehydrogenase (quinone)